MNKVIIYGIGAGGGTNLNLICSKLSNRYEVIGYMDSFYKREFYQYKRVIKIDELADIYYDYILINTCNQSSDDEIYDVLLKYGISPKKIVRYAKYAFYSDEFPIKHIENKLDVFKRLVSPPEFDGFLIGMSYAESGIDVNQMSEYIYNFSQSAFDLFYRKLLIQSLFELKKEIEHIRYIILELPYYIFNFDLSLCDNALFQSTMNYVSYWKEYHHFTDKEDNVDFLNGFSVFQDMFLKDHMGNYSIVANGRAMGKGQYVDDRIAGNISHTICKSHEATIIENKIIFHEIMQMIKEKNSSIKLVILVCPQPSVIRKLYSDYPLQKQVFLNEMALAQEKQTNLIILDEHELFAGHDEYFGDMDGHLNQTGCDIFTRFLDEKLKKLNFYRR